MKHVAASTATSVLCALWLGACASTAQEAAVATPPAASPNNQAAQQNADAAALAKDLPTTLDGEIRRAQGLRSKGDLDDANHALAQLMLIAPDDARVVGEYGKTLAQQGRTRDAVAFLQRAVQLEPTDWTLYSALGVAYDQADDHTQARHAYTHALAISPGQPSVLNNMAVSYMLTKDWAGAQRYLGQASAKGGAQPKISNNLTMLANLDMQVSPAASTPKPAMPAVVQASTAAQAPSATRQAVAPPKSIQPTVVVQALPKDSLAGPVKQNPVKQKPAPAERVAIQTNTPARAPAKAPPKTQDRVAHLAPPPALRTAAETN